jgi:hypothetical protein
MTSDFYQHVLTAYQKLFWPDFVEHDDCVFLAFDEAKYRQWLQQTDGDKQRVEAMMNHRHIIDLLPRTVESPTRGLVVSFGQLLRDVWETKLRRDFPKRQFCVSFSSEESEDLSLYEVTFSQMASYED